MKKDQGPSFATIVGWLKKPPPKKPPPPPPRVIAVRATPPPGQFTLVGELTPCWLTTAVPLISNFAVAASPLSVSGVTAMVKDGMLPPVPKKASRISDACWNCRKVTGDRPRATTLSSRQVHCAFDWSTYAARLSLKNLSMIPLGMNSRAKSAIGTSRSTPFTKG